MKTIKPRNDNVVLVLREAGTTSSGIVTTTEVHDKDVMIVESVGPGIMLHTGERVPLDLKPGDLVYVAAGATYSAYDMPDGQKRLVVPESCILGVEADDGVPVIKKLN